MTVYRFPWQIPCECGHLQADHASSGSPTQPNTYGVCLAWRYDDAGRKERLCGCPEYRPVCEWDSEAAA